MNILAKMATSPKVLLGGITLLLGACTPGAIGAITSGETVSNDPEAIASSGERYADYQIVTLLPRDAIPAIDDPKFLDVADANDSYDDDELIQGVEFNGDARAYSVPLLSSHEIVNDTVGGVKISVTW